MIIVVQCISGISHLFLISRYAREHFFFFCCSNGVPGGWPVLTDSRDIFLSHSPLRAPVWYSFPICAQEPSNLRVQEQYQQQSGDLVLIGVLRKKPRMNCIVYVYDLYADCPPSATAAVDNLHPHPLDSRAGWQAMPRCSVGGY